MALNTIKEASVNLHKKELKAEVKEAPAKVEVAPVFKGFLPIFFRRFHKADGTVVLPNAEGYFVPADQEELDILQWHLSQGRVTLESLKY